MYFIPDECFFIGCTKLKISPGKVNYIAFLFSTCPFLCKVCAPHAGATFKAESQMVSTSLICFVCAAVCRVCRQFSQKKKSGVVLNLRVCFSSSQREFFQAKKLLPVCWQWLERIQLCACSCKLILYSECFCVTIYECVSRNMKNF